MTLQSDKDKQVEDTFEGDEVEKFFWYAMGIDIREEEYQFDNTEEEWLGY